MNYKDDLNDSKLKKELKKVVIEDFLHFLNRRTNKFILKGGTGLMECYGLPRISDDIDMDCVKQDDFFEIVDAFCKKFGYTYNVGKNTPSVQRAMIHTTPNDNDPLKIEVSYRNAFIDKDDITQVNDIEVYTLDEISKLKANAYNGRDKIRDMFDLCFLINDKREELSEESVKSIRRAFASKGLEQYDYIYNDPEQNDPFIDKEELGISMLDAFDNLGLLVPENERDSIKNLDEEERLR